MRVVSSAAGALLAAAVFVLAWLPASAGSAPDVVARQIVGPNDGWAAFGTGTSGGSAAEASHVFTVSDRNALAAAVAGSTPKIVFVSGTLEGNVDDANQPLGCDAYARNGYTLAAYLQTYDPAVWGRTTRPSGPLEDARAASQKAQAARVQIKLGSNTTLVGLPGATLDGINLIVAAGTDNVIIRNLTLTDAFDCFPQWDPTDGGTGNWNSQYDNISLLGGTHVWVDHCTFSDGNRPDSTQPLYFGRPFQWHDGELDITKASDLVTVSWNRFTNHDKTMLIGSSDTATSDIGHLRVTIHHNLFQGIGQRAPRVRFGLVHVYNNLYDINNAFTYVYTWGVGVQSHLFVKNNYVLSHGTTPDLLIHVFGGTAIHVVGTWFQGAGLNQLVDVLGAYNAANDADLSSDVGWTPTLFTPVDPAQAVPGLVGPGSGPNLI